ncbi:sulfate/molybdate ABC transporter ATP-binding protein [Tannockella kyphosi]|uniref:sulfate/molybdate ABC transporter ATP-binding protein n=1 Tax=Tannockella kyphosi TaxID=2899121 RepID=UPI0020113E26|nr:ATP-binding cassette domain-containing protein [Tannockella kyphosi]
MSIYCKIKKEFDNFKLDIEFFGENEILSLLGASGSGKSLILRCIAGVEKPDSGTIVVDDCIYFDSEKKIDLSPQERHVGLLFQDYALFPNMTVRQNIAIAYQPTCHKTLDQVLEDYQLTRQQHQYPDQLSGGQKQRCALARMIVTCPTIILLDEPFSALDSFLKYKLEKELFQTLEEYGKTVLFVSHNRDEVYRLSHKVSVITNGSNLAMKEKHELFLNPQTYDSAILTGCQNLYPARLDGEFIVIEQLNLRFHYPTSRLFRYVGIRANDFYYIDASDIEDDSIVTFHFHIQDVTERLFSYLLTIVPRGGELSFVMEVSKDKFAQIKESQGVIAVAKSNIMLLKD